MIIQTLFGPAQAKQKCDTCYQEKLIENFYLESSSKARHNEQRRKQCIDCWAKFKGRKTFRDVSRCEVLV
jgi:hypothetical protein